MKRKNQLLGIIVLILLAFITAIIPILFSTDIPCFTLSYCPSKSWLEEINKMNLIDWLFMSLRIISIIFTFFAGTELRNYNQQDKKI